MMNDGNDYGGSCDDGGDGNHDDNNYSCGGGD